MKTSSLILIGLLTTLIACGELSDLDDLDPTPEFWGPATYQVDAVFENDLTRFYARIDADSQLVYSAMPTPAQDLPFRFYDLYFSNFREIMIASPYPLRANWFQIQQPLCLDRGETMTGIEFATATAREKDYLLIARLDSTYWECLRASPEPLRFSFRVKNTFPVTPSRFALRGFFDRQQDLVHLKAFRDATGTWYPTYDYQVYQEPGPQGFSIQLLKPVHLGPDYSLLRMSSSMQLVPHSVWIGLAGECLDQADWEVHQNRHENRFLLDVVIPIATWIVSKK